MSRIVLITGGARSGKSSYSEGLLQDTDEVLYLATAIRTDEEMDERIRHHISSRNPKWITHEGFHDLDRVIKGSGVPNVLLDCVTNMVSNLMFHLAKDPEKLSVAEGDELYERIRGEFTKLIRAVRESDKTLILVSNEVGMGLISEYKLGRMFVDYAGFINQMLAHEADEVYFMVSGLPLVLKQGSQTVSDPHGATVGLQTGSIARFTGLGGEAEVFSSSDEMEAFQGPGMTEEL